MGENNKPEWYDRKWCVYRHTFPSGKIYIGQTWKDPETKWDGGRGYLKNTSMYEEIKLVGWENIKHEIILSGLRRLEADNLEEALISEAISKFGKDNVYNVQKVDKRRMSKDRPDYILANKLVNYCTGKEIDEYVPHQKGWLCFTDSDFIRAAKLAGYSVKITIDKDGIEQTAIKIPGR